MKMQKQTNVDEDQLQESLASRKVALREATVLDGQGGQKFLAMDFVASQASTGDRKTISSQTGIDISTNAVCCVNLFELIFTAPVVMPLTMACSSGPEAGCGTAA